MFVSRNVLIGSCYLIITLSGCAGHVEETTKPAVQNDDQTTSKTELTTTTKQITFFLDEEVAKRKSPYQEMDTLIDNESQRTVKMIQRYKAANYALRKDISYHRRQIRQLNKQFRRDPTKKAELLQQQKQLIETRYKDTLETIQNLANELQTTQALYNEAKTAMTSANKGKLKAWELRINKLGIEKTYLERQATQLQAINPEL